MLLVPAFLQQQYTFITPHALDIPVGAFTALATAAVPAAASGRVWVLLLAALGVVGVKGSNIVVAVARRDRPGRRGRVARDPRAPVRLRALRRGIVLLGVDAALFAAFQALVVRATQVGDYDPPGDYVVTRSSTAAGAIDSFSSSRLGRGALGLAAVWLVMAMTGTALASGPGSCTACRPSSASSAPGFLLGMALGAVVLDLMVFVTTGQYFGDAHLRYGLALCPLGLAFLALLLRTRTALVLAAVGLLASTPPPRPRGPRHHRDVSPGAAIRRSVSSPTRSDAPGWPAGTGSPRSTAWPTPWRPPAR